MSDGDRTTILIFAGNYREARDCARANCLSRWQYLDIPDRLYGTAGAVVWRYGSWRLRDDTERLERLFAERRAVVTDAPTSSAAIAEERK